MLQSEVNVTALTPSAGDYNATSASGTTADSVATYKISPGAGPTPPPESPPPPESSPPPPPAR